MSYCSFPTRKGVCCMDIRALLTRENIMIAVSVSAFVMSLMSWVHVWACQRRKLEIKIFEYMPLNQERNFFVSFENRSRLPVLITRIFLLSDSGGRLECLPISRPIYEDKRTSGGVVTYAETTKNLQLPIAVSSLGGCSGWITFEDPDKNFPSLSSAANFLVHTNRGRPFRLSLPLGRIHRPPHTS